MQRIRTMKRLKWFIGFIIFGCVVCYLAGHHEDYLETTAKIHAPQPVGETGSVLCPDTDTFDSYWNEEMGNSERIAGEFIASRSEEDNALATSKMTVAKKYGCSYIPPGIPVSSEGGISGKSELNAEGNQVVIENRTAHMSNGTVIQGVGIY
jgi:hypothetical protein